MTDSRSFGYGSDMPNQGACLFQYNKHNFKLFFINWAFFNDKEITKTSV
jgi:hypothetical protein